MNDFANFFGIQGNISVPDGVDFNTFCDKFTEAMKVLGWRFGGFFEENPDPIVVEIVRCRDCRLWKRLGEGLGKCPFLPGEHQYVGGDHFCSLGVKEEES